ncbi:glutathione S-transferase [Sinobacterium caligoides]|uniref:Glutathione S-transferase n=1 Tax=Sinobacterium caligoides TaxID=933926 RepID=A0A3N2DMW9_9GAMM|nr:glutathione S-transferase family protein [Sinobacterium caligoides]ROS01148.1 glutathione S-transferase [Sinobacterium caligoides]
MINIYGHPHTRSFRITWIAEELALDYLFHRVELAKGEHKSEDYRRLHPGGKIPAITDDIDGIKEISLSESGAIVNYLADRYGSEQLIPSPGSPQRGSHDQWCYFALTELEQPLWSIGKHKFALPKEQRIKAMLETAGWEYQQALALLSSGLGDNNYILGSQFSPADILLAQTLRWGLAFKQPLPQQNLQDYFQRCSQRPGFIKAAEVEEGA